MDPNNPTTLSVQPTVGGEPTGSDPAAALPQATSQPQNPAVPSEESEELDQEWINKAKDVVEKTKSDPFMQSRELNKVKAGYLKARYNKELKIDEDIAQ